MELSYVCSLYSRVDISCPSNKPSFVNVKTDISKAQLIMDTLKCLLTLKPAIRIKHPRLINMRIARCCLQ